MTPPPKCPSPELEDRLRFETLLAELSLKFVNLPAGDVDREIIEAQRRLCEFLGLDFATLWRWSDESPGFFTLTHFYSAQAGPQPPGRMNQEQYPWARQQLLAGLGYYEVDYGERTCFLDDRFREICGVPSDLQPGLDPQLRPNPAHCE